MQIVQRASRFSAVVALLLVLVLAACGGGGSSQPATPIPASVAPPTAPRAAAPAMPGGTANAPVVTQAPNSVPSAVAPAPTLPPLVLPTASALNPNMPTTVLTEVGAADAHSLNPILIADPVSDALSRLFFSGLVTINPKDGTASPDLAESWTTSDDGLTWTFKLRPNVQWSDNQPLTADDVAFSYNLYLNRDANSPHYTTVYTAVESVTAADPRTVRFKLRAPLATFLTGVATYGIVPQHVLINTQPADLATADFGMTSNVVGTGPYRLTKWLRNERIDADANPSYHLGKVAAPRYSYLVLPTDDAVRDALTTGKADFGLVSPAVQGGLKGTPGIAVTTYDTYELTYIGLQLDASKPAGKIFANGDVRRALMLALDRDALVKDVRGGLGAVADGIEPPPSWAAVPVDPKYRPNLDEAKRLLDNAGWKPGSDGVRVKDRQTLSFNLSTNNSNPVRERYAALCRDAWAKIGVNVTVVSEKFSAFQDRITRTRDFDAFVASYVGDVDPDTLESALFSIDAAKSGFNAGRYLNLEVNDLLFRARTLAKPEQRDARKDLYTKIQQRVMGDLPILPLDFSKDAVAVSSRVTNFAPSANDLGLRYRALAYTWGVNDSAAVVTVAAPTKKP